MNGRPRGQRHPRVIWGGDTVLASVGAASWRGASGSVKEWLSQKGAGKAVPFNSSWDIFSSTFLFLQEPYGSLERQVVKCSFSLLAGLRGCQEVEQPCVEAGPVSITLQT